MEKVQKPSNSVCYTPLSEPFRNYLHLSGLKQRTSENVSNSGAITRFIASIHRETTLNESRAWKRV
jgi:hypothetical protein